MSVNVGSMLETVNSRKFYDILKNCEIHENPGKILGNFKKI